MNEDDGREYIPAIQHELSAVVVAVGEVLYGLTMLPEFLYARVNAADCFAGGIVLAYRKTLPTFNRKGCNLLLENLTCNSGHGLIGIASFAFAVGALNNLTVRFLEISIQRLVVVTKGEVVHREAFVCRGHAIGCDCHLELFLLDLDIEALPLQVGLRFDGIKSLSADFFSRSYMRSNGNHVFRRVFFPILSNKFIFRALIMKGRALFVDVFQSEFHPGQGADRFHGQQPN